MIAGEAVSETVESSGSQSSAPRREPRPVRESLVIPVLVASPEPEAAPQGEDTSSEAAVDSARLVQAPAEAHGEEPSMAEPEPTEPAGSARRSPMTPTRTSTVDLTADQPADRTQMWSRPRSASDGCR